jgi:predicted dienelactone hydrolase
MALVATSTFALLATGPTMIASATMASAASGTQGEPTAKPPDPATPGPHDVTATEYNDGDTAFTPPGFGHAVEVRASVHYPTDIDAGPYPLIVLLHGRHSTCHSGSQAFGGWPCGAGQETIPSFQGYDYLAENLASWGYVVISISANGINAFDNGAADLGATARAQLIQNHQDKWKTFTTTVGSPFGQTFVGNVDLTNIGEMGHSRGGEGVVKSYDLNKSLGSPYGINAVLPLAPVDFNRTVINNVPLSVILPYCDGDVSDNQGIHFYDDALYNVAKDNSP